MSWGSSPVPKLVLSVSALTFLSLLEDLSQFYVLLVLSNPKMRDDFLNTVKTNPV